MESLRSDLNAIEQAIKEARNALRLKDSTRARTAALPRKNPAYPNQPGANAPTGEAFTLARNPDSSEPVRDFHPFSVSADRLVNLGRPNPPRFQCLFHLANVDRYPNAATNTYQNFHPQSVANLYPYPQPNPNRSDNGQSFAGTDPSHTDLRAQIYRRRYFRPAGLCLSR